MNTQVPFLIMPDQVIEDEVIEDKALLHQACLQSAQKFRNNPRVFIYTDTQERAHQVDELLWAFDSDSFIPHNLVGEGPRQGAAVEISWQAPTNRRPVLINLTNTVPDFSAQFSQIIDFVPAEESLKQQARDRFRTFRQWGFAVETQAATIPQNVADEVNTSN